MDGAPFLHGVLVQYHVAPDFLPDQEPVTARPQAVEELIVLAVPLRLTRVTHKIVLVCNKALLRP